MKTAFYGPYKDPEPEPEPEPKTSAIVFKV
jgi:hypothetical protein